MWKFGVAAASLALYLSTMTASAFEWNGFQSGMTADEVRDVAAEQGLELDREPDSSANVTVPLYSLDSDESRGFLTLCQGQLARVGTELRDLDLAHVASRVDENSRHGEARIQTMTMENRARGVELFWGAGGDEIGLVMVKLGSRQLMQETRADIGLWDLCANTGEEPDDDLDDAEDEEPPTAEEMLLDALGRALRGDDGGDN